MLLSPVSKRARDWVVVHIDSEAPRWGGAIAVEPRFIDGIIDGIERDGLVVAS